MKVVKWLSPNHSTVNGHALVRLEPGEIADLETMLILMDHATVGNFGYSARIIKVGEEEPEYKPAIHGGKRIGPGYLKPEEQFGFPPVGEIRASVCYYEVFVHRD